MEPVQILAVDDQISSLLALDEVLTGINANFIKATSAKEALLIMLKKPIDCVLLDVSMPDMDGFDFLKTLHNAPAHAKIPVLM
jgi:response regulator RpfG family c-di-GMP phosphodiesterase